MDNISSTFSEPHVSEKKEQTSVLEAYHNLANRLNSVDQDKPLEIRAAIAWGALDMCRRSEAIDWNEQHRLFGEFMRAALNLR